MLRGRLIWIFLQKALFECIDKLWMILDTRNIQATMLRLVINDNQGHSNVY